VLKLCVVTLGQASYRARVSDPHPFYSDTDLGLEIFADPDEGFEIFADQNQDPGLDLKKNLCF